MENKRNRTKHEKILDCLDDKVQNLHPILREKLIHDLQDIKEASNVSKCRKIWRR